MILTNILLLSLNFSFQFLLLVIIIFTFWGIAKLIILSKRIEKLKNKYFNHLVNNIIVVRIEYLRLMEDINFLKKFKDVRHHLALDFGQEVIQRDFEALEQAIFEKRKTINRFIWSLAVLGVAIFTALAGLLVKDFIFLESGFYSFLIIDITISIIALILIKFVL